MRADRRRMVALREETGVQRSLTERLVRADRRRMMELREEIGVQKSLTLRETGEGRQEKNGGVKGRDRSAEELDTERLVRADRRRMVELREEIGVQRSLTLRETGEG